MKLWRLVFVFLMIGWSSTVFAASDVLPQEVLKAFQRLDNLGRDDIKDAQFVDLTLEEQPETAWMVKEDEKQIVVFRDDLLPWSFFKNKPTRIPSSWYPQDVRLKAVKQHDFEVFCNELAEKKEDREDLRRRMHGPGPSYRVLVAHAAWKKGLGKYCEKILHGEPAYTADREKFFKDVWADLAWLHYLRGVNLLMYADRKEVLPHLQLAVKIALESDHATAAKDLLKYLEPMVAKHETKQTTQPSHKSVATMTDAHKAKLYISQLTDLWCPQMSQPGSIMPYVTVKGDRPVEDTPSTKLKQLGYAAVPALIEALKDDTPTRTVYHWRSFHRSRFVWRVSDFAWHILRDISGKEFGYKRIVGFTYSYMKPEEKKAIQDEVMHWHKETKGLSPDDRMMTFFSSKQFEDWITAAEYFAGKNDTRPVRLLLPRLKEVGSFRQGELCEVIASFKDPVAVVPIKEVMNTANEPADRICAAIALWELGDSSGVPVAINYVLAESQPYGSWDTPVWFLMYCQTDEAISALKTVLKKADARRVSEVLGFIVGGITGYSQGNKQRQAVGSVPLAEVLISATDRADETGSTINNVRQRIKDLAARALAVLRDGTDNRFGGPFVSADPKTFNEIEPDTGKRDKQIDALKQWYTKNKGKMTWDDKKRKLIIHTGTTPSQ